MKFVRPILAGLTVLSIAVSGATAQTANRPQMSPEVQAKMKAWQKWRDSHKNIESLQRTIGGLEALEKDPKLKLNASQAKSVVTILKTWRTKPTMTDAQALKVNKDLTAKLSLAQLKKIATTRGGMGMRERRPGGGAPSAQPGNRTGGNQPRTGTRRMDPSRFPSPREYNPLNPSTLPWENMREGAKKRLETLTKQLTARAK